MALNVGVNTYLSVADADTYWSDRNNSTWSSASTADKEKALLEATQFIDGAYTFIGTLADEDQTLAWPRAQAYVRSGNFASQLYDIDEIPRQVKDATAELALDALSARLRPSQERGGSVKREKVDVIEVEYSDFAPTHKTFSFVSMILRDITRGSKNNIKLMRS